MYFLTTNGEVQNAAAGSTAQVISINNTGIFDSITEGLLNDGTTIYSIFVLNYPCNDPPNIIPVIGDSVNTIENSTVGCWNDGQFLTEFICFVVNPLPISDPVAMETHICSSGATILDGTASDVPLINGGEVVDSWDWTLISGPVGNDAVLASPLASITDFTATVPGLYTIQLCVTDNTVNDDGSGNVIDCEACTTLTVTVVEHSAITVEQFCENSTTPVHDYQLEVCFDVDQAGNSNMFYVVVEDSSAGSTSVLGPFTYATLGASVGMNNPNAMNCLVLDE